MTAKKPVILICPNCGEKQFEQSVKEIMEWTRPMRGSKQARPYIIERKIDKYLFCTNCGERYEQLSELNEEEY